jgi:hypothetical protein
VSLSGILRTVVTALEANDVPFMLTGSVAAAAHGAGRATMDVDLVIQATRAQLESVVAAIEGPTLYVSREAALEALASESMFNIVDTETGWKADLIPCKSRPFSQAEFARRRPLELDGLPLWVASVEDVILSKLEWARLGGSARQLEDVAALLRVAVGEVDRAYLDRWIDELGLRDQWLAVQIAG